MDIKGFLDKWRKEGSWPDLNRSIEEREAVAERMMEERRQILTKYPYSVYVPYRAATREAIERWCEENYKDEHYVDLNHARFTTEAAATHFKLVWG